MGRRTKDGPTAAPGLATLPAELRQTIERLPAEPGVYLMKDRRGRIIYVGKAASLRARVRSYFTSRGDTRAFVALLGRLLGDVETIVVRNDKEALLLENTLIKQHHPRFNVVLRDDKAYLVLRLDLRASYPRFEVARRIRDDGARHFGPYHSAKSCRATLRLLNKHFHLRTCTDRTMAGRARPCLRHQLGLCPAPCAHPVPAYGEGVRDAVLFLDGKSAELTRGLRRRMEEAAAALEFERAALLRDRLAAVERTLTAQQVVATSLLDQDVVGFYREGGSVEIAHMRVRQGRLVGQERFSLTNQEFPDHEIVSSFVGLYYSQERRVPRELLLPVTVENHAALAEWLAERGGHPVAVLVPQRGPRRDLTKLACRNARALFASRRDPTREAAATLEQLQRRLRLRRRPRRIECFDISTTQGLATVGSRVLFVDGAPAKEGYRRFKVKSVVDCPDDYAALYEVLSRRLRRARGGGAWALPDLLVVDGGKGQLSTAMMALRDAGVDASQLDVIGLAKEVRRPAPRAAAAGSMTPAPAAPASAAGASPTPAAPASAAGASPAPAAPASAADGDLPDRVFLPRVKEPLRLPATGAELLLLARIRDEAHRFAHAYHSRLRRQRLRRSMLAEVPGIGPRRQRALLRHFGSLSELQGASLEALAAVPGITRKAAIALHRFLRAMAPLPAGTTPSGHRPGVAAATQDAPGASEELPAAPPETASPAAAPGDDGGATTP